MPSNSLLPHSSARTIQLVLKDFFAFSSSRFLLDHYIPLRHRTTGSFLKNPLEHDFLVVQNQKLNRGIRRYRLYDLYVQQAAKDLTNRRDVFFMVLGLTGAEAYDGLEQARGLARHGEPHAGRADSVERSSSETETNIRD